jgi:eukaryotic-like serine/threonine-protein kinase
MSGPILEQLQQALAGRYAIERELGHGGMATVYLAHDLRHHRQVAIKVLRPELATAVGPERFLREVELVARLQHPHILPVHDSGEAGGLLYFVMPLVEGESLRQRLSREGELPVPDAVRLLSELADALAYAHRRGVVHRDIKPDNVLLAGRHAWLADFGVAKLVSQAVGAERLTETGVSLGTPLYMAPEQAAADPQVDHRADLYAFGVVGYEMLTGAPPFRGLNPQQVLAAKVTRPAELVTAQRAAVPEPLAEVIMKCLERRPADRFQSADEVLTRLEAVVTPTGVAATPGRLSTRRRVAVAVGLLAVVTALGFGVAAVVGRKPFTLTTSDAVPVTSEPGVEFLPALSPDGSQVAYVKVRNGRGVVAIRSTRQVLSGEVRPAEADTGDQSLPTWSPDGESIRFTRHGIILSSGQTSWTEVGRLGGGTRPVMLPGATSTAAAWSRDGSQVAYERNDTLCVLSAGDSTPRPVTPLEYSTSGDRNAHSMAWSPDGHWIAYVAGNLVWLDGPNTSTSSIWIAPATGGKPVQVVGRDKLNVSPAWLDADHLLFVSNREGPREVYVVAVGPEGPRGEPTKVPGGTDAHSISVSADGRRLAVAKFQPKQNVWSYPVNPAQVVSVGSGRRVTSGTQVVETHDLSPDGQWLVYSSNLRGNADLYKVPVSGGEPIPLTDTPTYEYSPSWSPVSGEVAYESDGDLYVLPGTGGAAAKVVSTPAIELQPVWSPDGLQLAFGSNRPKPWVAWTVQRERVGGNWAEPRQVPGYSCFLIQWSPDGKGLLCRERDTAVVMVSTSGEKLWRRDLAAAGLVGPKMSSGTLSNAAKLSPDGSTLYVEVAGGPRAGVWSWPLRGGAPRLIVKFSDPSLVPYVNPGTLRVSRDEVYLTIAELESDIWVMNLHR